jgi:hypothetical protein
MHLHGEEKQTGTHEKRNAKRGKPYASPTFHPTWRSEASQSFWEQRINQKQDWNEPNAFFKSMPREIFASNSDKVF